MENQTIIEKLDTKITELMQKYNTLKLENETFRTELVTLKAESEIKNQEIEKLRDQNTMKDLEIEEIVSKIESLVG